MYLELISNWIIDSPMSNNYDHRTEGSPKRYLNRSYEERNV